MLRKNVSPALSDDIYIQQSEYTPGGTESNTPRVLLEYWYIIRNSKWTVCAFVLGGIVAAALVTMALTPIYQARTTLEMQELNGNFLGMKSADPTIAFPEYSQDAIVQTQIKILQSNSVMKRVVARLASAPPPPESQQATALNAWKKVFRLKPPTQQVARRQAIDYAARHMAVKAADNTRIVEIACDSPDPQIAAAFVNTVADEHMRQNIESRWKSTQHTGEWLTEQLESLKVKLERSEDQLQAYAQSTGLMFTGEKESVSEDKLRQQQQELLKAESDRVLKQSKYELSLSATPEALPEVLDDSALRDYQAKLTDLRRQYAELGSTLTPEHYKLQKLQAQIVELTSAAQRERNNVISRIRTDYDSAKRREDLIRAAYLLQTKLVSDQSAKAIHYGILKREVDTNRQLYDSMLQKVKEAGITAAMRANNIHVVDAADVPLIPYKPNPLRNALMGVMGGLCLGIVFVLVRDRIDSSIQSPGDASMFLNVPELGVIPTAQSDNNWSNGTRERLLPEPRKNGPNLELAVLKRSPSLLAESFRSTLTSILFSNQNGGGPPSLIVLTSPNPSEGKTTVLCNIGLAMIETHRRVLLIDGDMRRPRLHNIFGVANTCGLRDILDSNELIEKVAARAIVKTESGLCVITSGIPSANISTLLYSARLTSLLQYLQQKFDAVLIDTPPMLHMPDARVLGRLADGVVLVIRSGKTTRDAAQHATQRFFKDGTPVLGTILNDWNPQHKTVNGYKNYTDGYYEYQANAESKEA